MKTYLDTNCPLKTRYEKNLDGQDVTITDNCDSECEWFMDEEKSCAVTVIARILKTK